MDNYEEKYKAALGWMQSLYGGLHGATKEEAEKYFPELKEPNDERIRKELIEQVAYITPNNDELDDELNTLPTYQKRIDKYRAWLEKQGEKKSMWTDNDRTMAFTLLRDVDQMTYISDEGKNERLEWLNSLEDKFNNVE